MDLVELSTAELVEQVTTWAGRVAAGEARLLALVGELEAREAREAWAVHGVRSCAHWLSWRIGWTPGTARERVRVARALRHLPLTAGRVSYAQVRALTRVVTAADEDVWLDLARHCTAAQLERAARGGARAKAAEQPLAERAAKPAVHTRWDDSGDLVLTLRFPAHEAVGVLAALEQHQAAVQTERDATMQTLAVELATEQGVPAEAPDVPAGTSEVLLHQQGYQRTLHTDRTLTVRTADGDLLEHHPTLPHAPAGTLPHVTADTLPSKWTGERMDLGYVVNVLLQHAA